MKKHSRYVALDERGMEEKSGWIDAFDSCFFLFLFRVSDRQSNNWEKEVGKYIRAKFAKGSLSLY